MVTTMAASPWTPAQRTMVACGTSSEPIPPVAESAPTAWASTPKPASLATSSMESPMPISGRSKNIKRYTAGLSMANCT